MIQNRCIFTTKIRVIYRVFENSEHFLWHSGDFLIISRRMTGRLDVIPSIISDPTAFPYSDWLIICGMAWIQRSFFLWHQVREARADVVWAYKASCNLKSFFKFHRRFLQREMPMVPKLSIPVTDVRDVAGAHITAMTSPKAPGKKPTSIPVFLLFSSFNFRWGTGGKGERAWDWGWERSESVLLDLPQSSFWATKSHWTPTKTDFEKV